MSDLDEMTMSDELAKSDGSDPYDDLQAARDLVIQARAESAQRIAEAEEFLKQEEKRTFTLSPGVYMTECLLAADARPRREISENAALLPQERTTYERDREREIARLEQMKAAEMAAAAMRVRQGLEELAHSRGRIVAAFVAGMREGGVSGGMAEPAMVVYLQMLMSLEYGITPPSVKFAAPE